MPGTLIRDTRGLLPRCNLLRVLHLRQRIHGPCTLPISQFPVLPISPNPTAPLTACSSTPASSSRIPPAAMQSQNPSDCSMQRRKAPAFPPLNPFWAPRSTAEVFTRRQHFCVKRGITEHQTPKWIHTFHNTYGTIFFLFSFFNYLIIYFHAPERIHGSENHCHFIALCFTSKCGFKKDLRKLKRYHGSAQ
jgi:hypothetical protein